MIEYCLSRCREIPYKRREQRHYCIILDKKGKIVSEAANSYVKTSPRFAKAAAKVGLYEKQCLHSEALALFRDKQRKGVKLIVVRVLADNSPANSKPCCICELLITEHKNIKFVEYSS
jgi:hypothetical protein